MPRLRPPSQEASNTTGGNENPPVARRGARLFEKGNPGSPGRPPGSKDKIAQAFFRDFVEVWEREGHSAIERLAQSDPRAFVYAAVAMVPKEVKVDAENRVYVVRNDPLPVGDWMKKHAENGDARTSH